jgi:hypothetical protein
MLEPTAAAVRPITVLVLLSTVVQSQLRNFTPRNNPHLSQLSQCIRYSNVYKRRDDSQVISNAASIDRIQATVNLLRNLM